MTKFKVLIRKNLILYITLGVFVTLFIAAAQGMESKDFVITLLRGLAVGSLTFLVASGFSLIFGLLDVLNLAHGTLFMIGAYIGWTVFVRPDTFVDLLTPFALIVSGFLLKNVWTLLAARFKVSKVFPGLGILLSVLIIFLVMKNYPISAWDSEIFSQAPGSFSLMIEQGNPLPLPAVSFEKISPIIAVVGLLLASILGAFSLTMLSNVITIPQRLTWRDYAPFAAVILMAVFALVFNNTLTGWLTGINSNWLFLIAVLVAVLSGVGLGGLMEVVLIRPLYIRPIYQLMLTLGMSAIGIEMVRAIWGRTEFTMPKPPLFLGSGGVCPATNFMDWWQNNCSTILVLGGRVRVYNEIFIPLVGIIVLVVIWVVLRRSRLGMIIRAGVQDREMVEALGINVRRVFTMVFSLGVGLASLGGALAAPSVGLSNFMGENVMINALIALAIGGLTSYPGAALGSLLVGLIQQFIIKYGQIGIHIPFTEVVLKPTPPIVPASTVLLMVIILLLLPNGLLGKKE